jgi:hypothetical protein
MSMHRPLIARAALFLFVGAAAVSSCAKTPPRPATPLPESCVRLLVQARCWLRKSGNDPREIDRALGVARSAFESSAPWGPPHAMADYCQMAQTFRRAKLEQVGCADGAADIGLLPAGIPDGCAPEEHFFIRRDGRVIGCRRDCASTQDCPEGSSCSAWGSAPGGPTDEPFCD